MSIPGLYRFVQVRCILCPCIFYFVFDIWFNSIGELGNKLCIWWACLGFRLNIPSCAIDGIVQTLEFVHALPLSHDYYIGNNSIMEPFSWPILLVVLGNAPSNARIVRLVYVNMGVYLLNFIINLIDLKSALSSHKKKKKNSIIKKIYSVLFLMH